MAVKRILTEVQKEKARIATRLWRKNNPQTPEQKLKASESAKEWYKLNTATQEQKDIKNKKGTQYRNENPEICKAIRNRRRDAIKLWYENLKKGLICSMCGFSDYRALQFHHRDPAIKESEVSALVLHNRSRDRILKEIDKCDILCANCHFIYHSEKRKLRATV